MRSLFTFWLILFGWSRMMGWGMGGIVRLSPLTFEVLSCRERNPSRPDKSNSSLFDKLIEVLSLRKVRFVSLKRRFCNVDVGPSFPYGLQTYMVCEGDSVMTSNLGSSEKQVVRSLRINNMKPVHGSDRSYCQVFTNPRVYVQLPPNPDTSIGCFWILLRDRPTTFKTSKEMIINDELDQV